MPPGGGHVGYLLAAFGGALGALARWGVAEVLPRADDGWPWATLLVNLTGCLLIGVLTGVLANRSPEPAWARPLLGVGVLGGYTTYSAFAVEVVVLTDAGALVTVLGYLSASVVGGVVAVAAGIRVARRAGR